MSQALGEWWRALSDAHLAAVLLERAEPPVATIEFLVSALGLRPGARVFDQCCGIGSLAVPLAARGFQVVGCDLGDGYAQRGVADARALGLHVELVCADAFRFVPATPCDAAFNWWTSFGYAADDAQNLEMLRRACEALVQGGRFALDTMNVPGVIHGFLPKVTVERAGIRLTRWSRLDLDAGLIHKRWLYTLPDGREVVHHSAVRLHTPWELRALLRAAGFADVALFGDLEGGPIRLDSPRCIAVATKGTP